MGDICSAERAECVERAERAGRVRRADRGRRGAPRARGAQIVCKERGITVHSRVESAERMERRARTGVCGARRAHTKPRTVLHTVLGMIAGCRRVY